MKIHTIVGIYFILIALGMFGCGGVVVFEILDPTSQIKFLFIIPTVIGVLGMLFYFKKLTSLENELKRLEK